MPTIQEKIYQDLRDALKSKKEPELSTLRLIKSEIQYELTKTGAQEMLDANMIQLLKKNISQRKDSALQYHNASRLDLAEKEEAEAKVIVQYLPEEIYNEDIESSVQEAIIAVSAKGLSDSGKVMGKVMLKFKGKNIDGSKVSEVVKRVLQALG